MIDARVAMWAAALWALTTFLLCLVYGLITPQAWHMHEFLEQVLPGFEWLTWRGLAIGMVESFLYGAYAGGSYALIHNALQRRQERG